MKNNEAGRDIEKVETGENKLTEHTKNETQKELVWVLVEDHENIKIAKNVLSTEQFKALWVKNILNGDMTGDKLILIWYMLEAKDIKEITPEKLVKMSIKEINQYISSNY